MPYTVATLVQKDPPGPDGSVAITVEFTGPGEPTKRLIRNITGSDTVETLKTWARSQSAGHSGAKALADSLAIGVTVSLAVPAPPTPPVPTAEEVWDAKAARYLVGKSLGLTNPTAITDLNALFADINATYLTAYL